MAPPHLIASVVIVIASMVIVMPVASSAAVAVDISALRSTVVARGACTLVLTIRNGKMENNFDGLFTQRLLFSFH
jgi:hypothetical protein